MISNRVYNKITLISTLSSIPGNSKTISCSPCRVGMSIQWKCHSARAISNFNIAVMCLMEIRSFMFLSTWQCRMWEQKRVTMFRFRSNGWQDNFAEDTMQKKIESRGKHTLIGVRYSVFSSNFFSYEGFLFQNCILRMPPCQNYYLQVKVKYYFVNYTRHNGIIISN